MPESLAANLAGMFANASVLDIGCGIGQYGEYLRRHSPGIEWVGIDGAERVEEATHGHVRFADLTDGLPRWATSRPWDWVMAIEVAEHISRDGEAVFMHNLVSRLQRGAVLSWARPGQGHGKGADHPNPQTRQYVQCAMRQLGLMPDPQAERRLLPRHNSSAPCLWLQKTLMVFVPIHSSARPFESAMHHRLRSLTRAPVNSEFVGMYANLTAQNCKPFVPEGSGQVST